MVAVKFLFAGADEGLIKKEKLERKKLKSRN